MLDERGKCLDPRPIRNCELLGATADHHERALVVEFADRLEGKPRLPDPGLTGDHQGLPGACARGLPAPPHRRVLTSPSDIREWCDSADWGRQGEGDERLRRLATEIRLGDGRRQVRGRVWNRGVLQNRLLEVAQVPPGLEAKLVAQNPATG